MKLILIFYETRSLYDCSNEIVDCLVSTLRQRWALPPLLSSPCKPTKSILIFMTSNLPCSLYTKRNKRNHLEFFDTNMSQVRLKYHRCIKTWLLLLQYISYHILSSLGKTYRPPPRYVLLQPTTSLVLIN